MSGKRLLIGAVVMGVLLPGTLFYLLALQRLTQFLTISASTFLAWGAADLLANVMSRPRLQGKSAGQALRDDMERRAE